MFEFYTFNAATKADIARHRPEAADDWFIGHGGIIIAQVDDQNRVAQLGHGHCWATFTDDDRLVKVDRTLETIDYRRAGFRRHIERDGAAAHADAVLSNALEAVAA